MPDEGLPIIKPNPDPSELTTDQIRREVQALRDLIEVRLNAMDKAVDLLQSTINKSPTIAEVALSVKDLDRVHEERFRSIGLLFETQFKERDSRSEQTARDSKVAVDAAFAAAKEAVGEQNKSNALSISKSEAATTKQLDQINISIASSNLALNDKIDDLKSRVTSSEGKKTGGDDSWKIVVAVAAILLSIVGIGLSMVATLTNHHP